MNIHDTIKYAKNITALVVDDDPEVLAHSSAFFSLLFKKIDVASSGLEGLEKFLNNEYDIVITDIKMPQMDGVELSRQLREIKFDQKIVVATAFSETEDLISLLKIGVDGFIPKPFSLNSSLQSLSSAINAVINEKLLLSTLKSAFLQSRNVQNNSFAMQEKDFEEFFTQTTESLLLEDYFKADDEPEVEPVVFLREHCSEIIDIAVELPELLNPAQPQDTWSTSESSRFVGLLRHAESIFHFYSPYLDSLTYAIAELAEAIEKDTSSFYSKREFVTPLFDSVANDLESYVRRFSTESLAMRNNHHIHKPTALSIAQITVLIKDDPVSEADEALVDDLFF